MTGAALIVRVTRDPRIGADFLQEEITSITSQLDSEGLIDIGTYRLERLSELGDIIAQPTLSTIRVIAVTL